MRESFVWAFGARRRIAGAVLASALAASMVAGCGSGDSSTSTSSSATGTSSASTTGGEASAAVQAAKAQVAKYAAEQPPLEVPSFGGTPPSGKSLALLSCALPVCKTAIDASVAAAKQIGWTPKVINWDLTPEGYVSAWNQVLQSNPDAVVYVGALPSAIVQKQLDELAKRKVPAVVLAPAGDQLSGPVVASYAGAPAVGQSGTLMGDVVVADSGSTPPKAVLVTDKNFEAVFGPAISAFTKLVSGAGGSTQTLAISAQDAGKGVPGQIVSFLQANPDVTYVVAPTNDYLIGVPQALASAGLADKVKLIGRAPQAANLKDIAAGRQFAGVTEENEAAGWRSVDALARTIAGKDDFEKNPQGQHQIITKDNASDVKLDASQTPATTGSPEAFLEAWGVSGQ